MTMKIYRNRMVRRVIGSITAFCFLAIGAFALLGNKLGLSTTGLDADGLDRVFWFGITSIVGGILALAMSWLIKDIDGVWCSPPRRWWFPRKEK
jgi:hypothetical protein